MIPSGSFILETPSLRLVARLTPWDTDCFGFAVGQIDMLECLNNETEPIELRPFFQWLDHNSIRLISCRLPYDRLAESMLLEAHGFRFIESVLHPYLNLPDSRYQDQEGLRIELACAADIPTLEAIADQAFFHGRIHADPRLGPVLGSRRYSRWVSNSFSRPSQRLLKILNEECSIVALFITETGPDQNLYWHLTAIAPQYQGQGYGWRVWRAMLAHHTREGVRSVQTTITAGNVPILNMYSKLGARFSPPEMTFHWVRESPR
jgi:RimJ/RimL family protein N-acetyltransferase